ncbi:MAG: immunoglobulin domain-containing protein, partial [Bacteroidota bacterium]
MRRIVLLLMFLGLTFYSISQSSSCFESDPFCTGTSYEFPASTNAPPAEDGPDYGCLTTQPNPVWYHLRIEVPGDIVIDMYSEPLVDIDFIAWGPFDDPYEPCLDDLTGDKIEDCSYSGSSTETCNITGAEEGEYYILMITNFSNQECNINFSQTGGDGATDCGILPGQISSNAPVCEGDTLFLSANTVSGAEYNWTGPDGFTSSQQDIVIPDASQENAGEYELIIEVGDEVSDPVYYDVVVHETPQMNAGEDQSIPFGTFTELEGSLEGTPEDYDIIWEPDDMLQQNGVLNPTTVNLESTVEYTLRTTAEATGCYSEDNAVVTVTGGPLSVEVSTVSDEICYGEQIQLRAQTSGGSGDYEYEWSAESGDFSSDIYNPTVAPESTTTYNVEVTDGFNTVTGQVTVVVNELPMVEAVDDFSIPHGTSTTLEATASGGTGSYSYSWEDETFLVEDDVANPQTTNLYNPTTFTVEVTDAKGCQSGEDQTLVSLSGGPLTAVPSASPQTICYGDTTLLKAAAS